jgi:hypothetical protein
VPLSGSGTQGKVAVSAAMLAFGSDPHDPNGLVDCGATGLSQSLTVMNVGNQAFNLTAATLALGAGSPFSLPGTLALPLTVPIGGGITLTLAPKPIPAVANPTDTSRFHDTLTLTTDAAGDAPHTIALVMQARGAVVADTPLFTSWSFATVGAGATATFTSTLRNTGNAPASVSLVGLAQPTIFGVRGDPVVAAPGVVTSLVGQFTPPSASGAWSDRATLVVTPLGAFCAPLPAQWNGALISLDGRSDATRPQRAFLSHVVPSRTGAP